MFLFYDWPFPHMCRTLRRTTPYLSPKTHMGFLISPSRVSTVCLFSPIPTGQQVRKRADLVDEHCSCSGERADLVEEHLAAGVRPIDMQVERVRQHHVTKLLRQKRINSEDFTAVGAFVGGKRRRKDHRQSSVVSRHSQSSTGTSAGFR